MLFSNPLRNTALLTDNKPQTCTRCSTGGSDQLDTVMRKHVTGEESSDQALLECSSTVSTLVQEAASLLTVELRAMFDDVVVTSHETYANVMKPGEFVFS